MASALFILGDASILKVISLLALAWLVVGCGTAIPAQAEYVAVSEPDVRLLLRLADETRPTAVLVYQQFTIVMPYVAWRRGSCELDARGTGVIPSTSTPTTAITPVASYEVTGCPSRDDFRGLPVIGGSPLDPSSGIKVSLDLRLKK